MKYKTVIHFCQKIFASSDASLTKKSKVLALISSINFV